MKKENIINLRTDFLLPKKGFIVGLGSIFNIYGDYFEYNTSDTPEEADRKALSSDWNIVGADLEEARRKLNSILGKNDKSNHNSLEYGEGKPELCR
ncbi:hypothetical protein SAMN05421789_10824 [Kaistella chaponensis]|jgi:hypothetical protein|uniref:Uncharacterized protein n=1 Tax=Kaistella chaponensis TaxID=713588 RepID=A0A1N7MAN2_9FLAO|nr:hypothetical protein [Kaistella chaponensis]SIS83138.1 hypothetical protein SAMN05421789_10824 [Kaistella chaponensis]